MKFLPFILSLGIGLFFGNPLNAQSSPKQTDILNSFTQQTKAISSFGKASSTPNFIRFPKDHAFSVEGENVSQKVEQFITKNGALFNFRPAKDF